ncbi:DUF4421 family protein [Flammeovirga kamogawensis]|nr:DUF4421 family protein [Flammeovirga kamogawensis]MBB6462490.1 hypothetical protein [Flammeovirga kamogawensis]TRX68596.1 DUF4421 domain-containing protein [Flammeovirga kamogawensis]
MGFCKLKLLFIIAFTFTYSIVFSQKKPEADSVYLKHFVRDINDKISGSIFMSNSKLQLTFNNHPPNNWWDDDALIRRDRPKDVVYIPNNSYLIGLGISFGNLGVRASIQTPISEYNEDIYGKSSVFRLRVDGFVKKWYLDAEYYRYSGFTDTNVAIYDSTWNRPEKLIREDIITRSINLNAVKFTNKKFSYKAVFKQKEIQLKSAFTTYYKLRFRSENYNAAEPFIPPLARNPDSKYGTMTRLRMNDFTVIGGGAGVLVWNGFFLGAMVGAGIGVQHQSFTLSTESGIHYSMIPALDIKASGGYNTEKMFITFQLNSEITYSALPSTFDQEFLAISYFSNFEVNCGYRFDMGPHITRSVEWANHIIHTTVNAVIGKGHPKTNKKASDD